MTQRHQSQPLNKLGNQPQISFCKRKKERKKERKVEFSFCQEKMATSISLSSFHGSWGTLMVGEDYGMLARSVPLQVRIGGRKPVRAQPMMKNVNEGKGIFAPIVVFTRNIIGKKRFNQIRGKAIALHSQV